jgi:hypothetical protein
MNTVHVLSGVVGASLLLATGAFADILGVEPGTSSNPKDNVPKEIQRSTPSGETFGPGSSGPGTRSDELTGMKKEKPESDTQQKLEQNAEKTHEGGAAVAAEALKEKEMNKSDNGMKSEGGETAATPDAGSDGPRKDPKLFQQLSPDKGAQSQDVIKKQPIAKQ